MTNRFLRSIYFILAILSGAGTSAVWAQNELFVTDQGNNSVTVYPRTANGNVAPLRTLAGAATGLNGPLGLAVDTVNNELIVTNNNNNSVTVYLLTANGNVAPLRTLVGAATGLNFPTGLAVDTVNNELIVANSNNSITVYGRTANGNVGPLRTLVGAATGLNGSQGVAVDTVNNELVVANGNVPYSITITTRDSGMRHIDGSIDGDFMTLTTLMMTEPPPELILQLQDGRRWECFLTNNQGRLVNRGELK